MIIRMIAATLMGAVACGTRAAPDDTVEGPPVMVTVSTSQPSYRQGEVVHVRLLVENRGEAPVTFQFYSGQRYDFVLVGPAGDDLWRWSAGRGFAQVLGDETLAPGEGLRYEEAYREPLPPGRYAVIGTVTAASGPLDGRAEFVVE